MYTRHVHHPRCIPGMYTTLRYTVGRYTLRYTVGRYTLWYTLVGYPGGIPYVHPVYTPWWVWEVHPGGYGRYTLVGIVPLLVYTLPYHPGYTTVQHPPASLCWSTVQRCSAGRDGALGSNLRLITGRGSLRALKSSFLLRLVGLSAQSYSRSPGH